MVRVCHPCLGWVVLTHPLLHIAALMRLNGGEEGQVRRAGVRSLGQVHLLCIAIRMCTAELCGV